MSEKITLQVVNSAVEGDRISALITYLLNQLSQSNLKRISGEMGNNQLESAFNLKVNSKLN